VVVTLFGVVGSPTATSFVNTATITDPAYLSPTPVSIPTNAPGSNNAWTVLENNPPILVPSISIQKEVEVPLNSNIRQELVTVNSGQTIRFKITYTNTSATNINPTITDTFPTGITCMSVLYSNGTT
jgi:uncharacterized repeat protein (TIGR01451 family)